MFFRLSLLAALVAVLGASAQAAAPDLVIHNAKVVTVDETFSLQQAIAVGEGKIVAVGKNADILKLAGQKTRIIDAGGKLVMPGLIDSHVHATDAAMHEYDHPIPEMESIEDVLDYVRQRAKVVPKGEAIEMSQIFITRLREQRYPTRAELDAAAPDHPVVFQTGPDASVSTLALQQSGIDKDFRETGNARIERDNDGNPTGILRSASSYLKLKSPQQRPADEEQRLAKLRELFHDYNSVGITAAADRAASRADIDRYRALRDKGRLTVRMMASQHVGTDGDLDKITAKIREIGKDPLCEPNPWVRIIGIKTFLDGGMLTGSAYLREPWGLSKIYSITDPRYRGMLYIQPDRLAPIVRATVESKLQFTAHSVGDGAVHTLLDVYAEVGKNLDLRPTRPCITHANFWSKEAIAQAARLGVCADIQPAWLYLDTRTLSAQFGYDRLRYFQPLKSLFDAGVVIGGGSDHMQKIGSLRSVNPYNPFLGMWVAITRSARWSDVRLHPEEALTREQAIRFYTRNNAWLLFLEDQIGSLEPGKLADLIVVDRDLLTCPTDEIKDARVLRTFVAGEEVYTAAEAKNVQ